jgi:hypothetical protein
MAIVALGRISGRRTAVDDSAALAFTEDVDRRLGDPVDQ